MTTTNLATPPAEHVAGTDIRRSAPIVVGVSGSTASMRAVRHAARLAGGRTTLILVSAVTRRHRRPSAWGMGSRAIDDLKQDAYQLQDGAVVHEIVRAAREAAHRAGATEVVSHCVEGDPLTAIGSTVRDSGCGTVVLGGHTRAGRLARRMALSVPAVTLVFTDNGRVIVVGAQKPSAERRRIGMPMLGARLGWSG